MIHRPTSPGTKPAWPGGASFAFTIVDDTDKTTLENGPAVYDLLTNLGIKATKTVWPLERQRAGRTGGTSCADPRYLAWVHQLQADGHEIGYHNASDHSSPRERTLEALDAFHAMFGHDPRVGADHSANREALYWGHRRLSGAASLAHRAASGFLWDQPMRFEGEQPTSPYYWGDLCRDRVTYWRNFTYRATDTLAAAPYFPYHDPARPLVPWWYAATDAPHLHPLLGALAPARLDALETTGGACILYTHFGTNFVDRGRVHPRFVATMTALAQRNGWFVPAGELLDHLRATAGDHILTRNERRRLERRWVGEQLRSRASRHLRRPA